MAGSWLEDDARHRALLDWTLTAPAERVHKTKKALADSLGVSDRTLRDWEEHPEFKAAHEAEFRATAGSRERTKALLDQLYSDSLDPNSDKRVQAAKLYWDIARALAPPEPEVKSSRRAQDLSNDELRELLSDAALEELSRRLGVSA